MIVALMLLLVIVAGVARLGNPVGAVNGGIFRRLGIVPVLLAWLGQRGGGASEFLPRRRTRWRSTPP